MSFKAPLPSRQGSMQASCNLSINSKNMQAMAQAKPPIPPPPSQQQQVLLTVH